MISTAHPDRVFNADLGDVVVLKPEAVEVFDRFVVGVASGQDVASSVMVGVAYAGGVYTVVGETCIPDSLPMEAAALVHGMVNEWARYRGSSRGLGVQRVMPVAVQSGIVMRGCRIVNTLIRENRLRMYQSCPMSAVSLSMWRGEMGGAFEPWVNAMRRAVVAIHSDVE